MGTTRGEASKQACYQIKLNEEGAKHLAVTFESQLKSALLEQKEEENKMIIAQQEDSSELRENYKNFEEGITKEMKVFKSTVNNFIGNDLKKVITVDKMIQNNERALNIRVFTHRQYDLSSNLVCNNFRTCQRA